MKSSREVREAATLAERERIIKLLEDKGAHEYHDGYEELTCDTCNNIALIKGEELEQLNERKAITDWLRSRRASEPMRLTIERLAELIDEGKHLEQSKDEGENK
jgi:hypothetical protein